MKKFLLVNCLIIILASCSPLATADRNAKRNQQTILYPETKFDSIYAKNQLAKGKSTIKGILYKKTNKLAIVGGKTFGMAKKVELFPVNEYFMDWYNLREKKENKNTVIYMSNEAFSYRLETYTDAYGRFTFEEMKPGKYFLQSFMTTAQNYTRDVEVGTNSYGTRYYQKENYSVSKNHRIEKFIEIKNNGEIVEVKLN